MMKPRKTAPSVKEPEIAARLGTLIGDQSTRAAAKKWRVNYRRLAVWLKGGNAPEAENLRRIALATGVSVDWILGLPGAPEMRAKVADGERTVESECAARLARAIADHLHDEAVQPDRITISLPELLDWIGATIARELRPKLEEERRAMQTSEDAFAVEAMLTYLGERHSKPGKAALSASDYRAAFREVQDRLGRIVAPHVRHRAPWLPGLTLRRGAEEYLARDVIVGDDAASRLRAMLSYQRRK